MSDQKCKALTVKGEKCKRAAVKNECCSQHQKTKAKKSSPKKVSDKKTSKKSVTKSSYQNIYTLSIFQAEVDMENGKAIVLAASTKKLLQKEAELYVKKHKSHLKKTLSTKEIKNLPKELVSFENGKGEVYELVEKLYAVRLNKLKLRTK